MNQVLSYSFLKKVLMFFAIIVVAGVVYFATSEKAPLGEVPLEANRQ